MKYSSKINKTKFINVWDAITGHMAQKQVMCIRTNKTLKMERRKIYEMQETNKKMNHCREHLTDRDNN